MAFVSGLANLNGLTSTLPFLEPVLTMSPVVTGVIQGLLPPVLLAVLIALVPVIFMGMKVCDQELIVIALDKFSGVVRYSSLQLKLASQYFGFQVHAHAMVWS